MNRCLLTSWIAVPLLATSVHCVAQTPLPSVHTQPSASPQGQRHFPSHAQLGDLRLAAAPAAVLNGQPIRTAPGFRLFSPDNKLIFVHAVQDQDLKVAYVQEASTQWLLTAWILSPAETARLAALQR